MQIPRRIDPNERTCPVPDKVFKQLHQSNPVDAAIIAATLPESQRAQLAAFCYKRRHLSHLAILIAAGCNRHSLVTSMGTAGGVLFNQSRDPEKAIQDLQKTAGEQAKKAVSLARFTPEDADEESDDDDFNDDDTVVSIR